MGGGEKEDNRGIVTKVECMDYIENLGGRLVLIFIRAGSLVCLVGMVFFFFQRTVIVLNDCGILIGRRKSSS